MAAARFRTCGERIDAPAEEADTGEKLSFACRFLAEARVGGMVGNRRLFVRYECCAWYRGRPNIISIRARPLRSVKIQVETIK